MSLKIPPQWASARTVAQSFDISRRTLDRWLSRENLGFPRPHQVNGRKFFNQSEVDAWMRARATGTINRGEATQ
jgi:predicted DNA-binding transcriptional regulator AlpA